jgi:hypothetical protein
MFYDFETTQHTRYSEKAIVHEPNLVCLQQFCSQCESVEDIEQDSLRCAKRKHSFWVEPVRDLLSYLCVPRTCVNKVVTLAHNAKPFDLHFILNKVVFLKSHPVLIMSGRKVMCMKLEHLVSLDSLSFMSLPLRKLKEAFGLKPSKTW